MERISARNPTSVPTYRPELRYTSSFCDEFLVITSCWDQRIIDHKATSRIYPTPFFIQPIQPSRTRNHVARRHAEARGRQTVGQHDNRPLSPNTSPGTAGEQTRTRCGKSEAAAPKVFMFSTHASNQVPNVNNNSSISLFSPWQALYSNVNPFFTPQTTGQGNVATFPFPSPSLGFTFGDTFVPWPDLGAFNGATPGPGGMTPGSNGFPFPQQANQSKDKRKDSIQSLNGERQAPLRFDSTSSGGSTSAISVSLQSSTPESSSTTMPQQNSGPFQQLPQQQGFFPFQAQMLNYSNPPHAFGPGGLHFSPHVNTFPPSFNSTNQPSSTASGWNPYNGFTNQFYTPPSQVGMNPQAGSTSIEAPLVSRSSSTSTHHSAISPAMLSNMPSRMPSQPSAFSHPPEDDDVLVTVASSAAPSEYGGQGLSSRNPSPEITKKDRKRPASGPHGSRRSLGDNDAGSDGGSGEEEEPEPEGVERNGMMWGMKTGEYKALSARERKRVRNRISARTFRARRKGQSPLRP